jgi:uncharacterized membrane protein
MLNHVPVLGTVFGFALLVWALLRRNDMLQRVALATFVVVALAAIVVYLTGEPAEDVVERLVGTAEPAIEAHERAAVVSLIGVELLGVIALTGLLARRSSHATLIFGALVVSMVTAGLMARTANLGGQIRHAEVRGDAVQQDDDHGHRGEGR